MGLQLPLDTPIFPIQLYLPLQVSKLYINLLILSVHLLILSIHLLILSIHYLQHSDNASISLGAILSVVLFFVIGKTRPHWFVQSLLGLAAFVMSIAWLNLEANEVVSILESFGLAFNIDTGQLLMFIIIFISLQLFLDLLYWLLETLSVTGLLTLLQLELENLEWVWLHVLALRY